MMRGRKEETGGKVAGRGGERVKEKPFAIDN